MRFLSFRLVTRNSRSISSNENYVFNKDGQRLLPSIHAEDLATTEISNNNNNNSYRYKSDK